MNGGGPGVPPNIAMLDNAFGPAPPFFGASGKSPTTLNLGGLDRLLRTLCQRGPRRVQICRPVSLNKLHNHEHTHTQTCLLFLRSAKDEFEAMRPSLIVDRLLC